mgnify:CR=1 FL=1
MAADYGRRVWGDLVQVLDTCEMAAIDLSNELSRLHFSHAERSQSLGA